MLPIKGSSFDSNVMYLLNSCDCCQHATTMANPSISVSERVYLIECADTLMAVITGDGVSYINQYTFVCPFAR